MKAKDAYNVLSHVHPDTEVAVTSLTSPDGAHTVTFEEALANITAGRLIWHTAGPAVQESTTHMPGATQRGRGSSR